MMGAMRAASGRVHLVLVPGFGGFDALGQMQYYARVSERLDHWSQRHESGIELHSFDNLPTAAVATRARDLEEYLVKSIERHAIARHDDIVLLGHSTGGLDIRCLLERRRDLRARVKRVVFMSVPHYGTNLADFIDSERRVIAMLLWGLRHFPWVAGQAITIIKKLGTLNDSQIVVDAIDDLRRELKIPHDAWLAAEARRAAAELDLWRNQTASDFLAIQDLKTRSDIADKLAEIECLSFATVAPNPFVEPLAYDPVLREFGDAWALARDHASRPADTDKIFRLAYAACSAGPFARRHDGVEWLPGFEAAPGPTAAIEPWHNDSIVNTASMIWPGGQNWLVQADHADIIGHYERRCAPPVKPADPHEPPSHARHYEAYNLLRSYSQFGDACFHAIWDRVFAFAGGAVQHATADTEKSVSM
jgi:hypothetical protein